MVSKNISLIAGGALAALILVWLSSKPEAESFVDEDWSSYGSDSIEPRSGTAEYLAGEILLEPADEHRVVPSSADDTATAGVSPQDGGGLSQREQLQNEQQSAMVAAVAARDRLQSAMRQRDRARLLEAGFMPDRIDWIFQRSDVLGDEFIRIYGGGAIADDAALASMDPDARLRADIGEEEYTRYLEAIGRPRAISVDRLPGVGQP